MKTAPLILGSMAIIGVSFIVHGVIGIVSHKGTEVLLDSGIFIIDVILMAMYPVTWFTEMVWHIPDRIEWALYNAYDVVVNDETYAEHPI